MKVQNAFKTVLLVDDESDFHDLYTCQLEQFTSIKILHAKSGKEAYALMAEQKVDVVISDINMPNGNGLWLLDKLAAEYKDVPVIIASSMDMVEDELKSRGANSFIHKSNLNILSLKLSHLV